MNGAMGTLEGFVATNFIIITLALRLSTAAVIAVGDLQTCVNNGTDSISCAKKIVATLTLENNKLYESDELDFEVACINSPTGRCPCPCIYADDPTCSCRDLRRNIKVSVTKTPVYAVYPLSQPRMFNGRPYEEFITTGPGGSSGRSCLDGEYEREPTCGWAQVPDANGNMQPIPDSQGFCCKCPTLGGDPIRRGYRSCTWQPSWLTGGIPGAAYCLRLDDYWWYRGYVIGEYQLEFDVQVRVKMGDAQAPVPAPAADGGGSDDGSAPAPPVEVSEVLTLNPSHTTALSAARDVSARLLGDLDSYRQIQALGGHWVLIPVQPGLGPTEIFTSNLDMWVVLPPALVTSTGECDKVGVEYGGFRVQPAGCTRPLGACLRNQVYDLGVADAERVASGLEPLYNITRYGGGARNARQVAAGAGGGGLALRLPLAGVRTSLVSLEVRADAVQLVVNRAPAKILSSEVCTFDGGVCGGFQAIAARGFLRAAVRNTGAVAADFRAGLMGCTPGVLLAPEQFAAIPAGGTANFTFDLSMETDQAGHRSCTLVVSDSLGDIADSAVVDFYTNSTSYEPPPTQSDLGDKPAHPGDPPTFTSCRTMCPNLLNIKCLLLRGCWRRLVQALAVIALLAVLATVLWLALRNGWVKRGARCMACMLAARRPCARQKRRRDEGEGRSDGMASEGGGSGGGDGGQDPLGDGSFLAAAESPKKKRLSGAALDKQAPLRAKLARQPPLLPEQLIGAGHYGPPAQSLYQLPPLAPLPAADQAHVYLPLSYLETQQLHEQRRQQDHRGLTTPWAPKPQAPLFMSNNPLAWQDAGMPAPAARYEAHASEARQTGAQHAAHESESSEEENDEFEQQADVEPDAEGDDTDADEDEEGDDSPDLASTVRAWPARAGPGGRPPG